jgi:TM2 domain-containing membrane protein YozV
MAPAGWYPAGEGERFWDGRAWTAHVRPAPAPPPASVDAHGLPHHGAHGGPAFDAPAYSAPQVPVAPAAYPYAAQPTFTQVVPKNPAIAVLASFFLPGLGTMLNGQAGRGVLILLGYCVSWVLVIVLVGILGVFGFWVWGMVDAYQGAREWNARHGIYS